MDFKRVDEWVVTEKLGAGDAIVKETKTPRFRIGEGFYPLEIGVGSYLLFCGYYDAVFGKRQFCVYLFTQAITFFIVGIGYVGTFLPNSLPTNKMVS